MSRVARCFLCGGNVSLVASRLTIRMAYCLDCDEDLLGIVNRFETECKIKSDFRKLKKKRREQCQRRK